MNISLKNVVFKTQAMYETASRKTVFFNNVNYFNTHVYT